MQHSPALVVLAALFARLRLSSIVSFMLLLGASLFTSSINHFIGTLSLSYVCLLLQDLYKSCARGGGVKRGDVCYGMLRAAACVDESDHHALMYVRHGQTVREEGVDE